MRRSFIFLALCLTGCVPTTWLPDSSGFIYVKPIKGKTPLDPVSGQLVHFDLQKKTARVIVEEIANLRYGRNATSQIEVDTAEELGIVGHGSRLDGLVPAGGDALVDLGRQRADLVGSARRRHER